MTVPFLTLSQNAEFVFELAFALYAKRLTVALAVCGRAWILFESRKKSKSENCL
jgi:hypothetical protein